MAGSKSGSFFLWILLCLSCVHAHAQETHEPLEPVVDIKLVDSRIKVSASINLPVQRCVVYAVLTDYDKLPDYIPGILKIQYERIANNTVRVRQLGEVEVMFIQVHIESLIVIDEVPNERVAFRQIEGDLKTYAGEWSLSETRDGTQLSYDAALSFKQFVPMFMARSVLKKELLEQFSGIAREALSRKGEALFDCSEKK